MKKRSLIGKRLKRLGTGKPYQTDNRDISSIAKIKHYIRRCVNTNGHHYLSDKALFSIMYHLDKLDEHKPNKIIKPINFPNKNRRRKFTLFLNEE